jgi:SAM-dependent methyltransferase
MYENADYYEDRSNRMATPLARAQRFGEVIRMIFHFLPDKAKSRPDYLEIGPGDGSLSLAAAAAGWNVTCLDVSSYAVQALQKLGLQARVYRNELPVIPASADVVAMSHVIEHLPEPRRMLDGVLKALRPGGVLFVATPNRFSLDRYVQGPRWDGWDAPFHLVLFHPWSLTRIMHQVGFQIVFRDVRLFRSLGEVLSSGPRASQASNSPGLHWRRPHPWKYWVKRFLSGRDMSIIARRPEGLTA